MLILSRRDVMDFLTLDVCIEAAATIAVYESRGPRRRGKA